jgi:uncharacterized Zn-binding protein involved in type VI secretion
MGQPAARQGDMVTGVDIHIVAVPAPPAPPIPTPLPHPFSGPLLQVLSTNVLIDGLPAATVGSIAMNQPPHLPTPPGVAFIAPPRNQGLVQIGSTTVFISGQPAARMGDPVMTCNDPADAPVGSIVAGSPTVFIG